MKRFVTAALLAAALLALGSGATLGHSEYEASDPADGATLTEQPTQISATFSERTKPKQSSLRLKSPNGDIIATGGVPAGGPPTKMVIDEVPALDPGVYTVLWTTVALDGDGLKGSFTFTLEASQSAAPSAEASPSAAPSGSPSAAPSPTPAPTASPTPRSTPAASPSATPVASPSASAGTSGSGPSPTTGTDAGAPAASGSDGSIGLLALALAVVLVVAAGTWLYRRRSV
ncbi:MAG TPA: copper resistance protein CopC [Candidatus Limnocylindrales bacterium]